MELIYLVVKNAEKKISSIIVKYVKKLRISLMILNYKDVLINVLLTHSNKEDNKKKKSVKFVLLIK